MGGPPKISAFGDDSARVHRREERAYNSSFIISRSMQISDCMRIHTCICMRIHTLLLSDLSILYVPGKIPPAKVESVRLYLEG